MRQLCPDCGILSSEDAIACGYCGTSFLPMIQARPTEPSSPPEEPMPAPQPDEFDVSHSVNELTITWGLGAPRKKSAGGYFVGSLFLLGFYITTSPDAYCLMVFVLFLLGTVYWLIAMYANRTTLRFSDEEWVVSRGPVPLPNPDFYYRSERRIDPRKYEAVVALKDPTSKHGLDSMRDWVDVLIKVGSWLSYRWARGYLRAKDYRVTYTLYGRTRSGACGVLVTDLTEVEARFLERQLMSLLGSGLRPVEEVSVAIPDAVAQPASAEYPLKPLAEATRDGKATGRAKMEVPRLTISCPSCQVTNPADSAFCGECGSVLDVAQQ
jgi:ribosomal protein S27AE